MGIYAFAVGVLMVLAVVALIFGVSNDAVNFLNSSIGSRVAPRRVIMIVASLGIILGVTFSSGMMEVAQKGIFHPIFFTMPELMAIFLSVMLANILLLDLFNTFGLPTSTTVSVVFGLLGASVALSCVKLYTGDGSFLTLARYINTGTALVIISGILLSVALAFIVGAIVQFFTRLLFTFDYPKRLRRYGAAWGGISLSIIAYFILIKGAKGASFIIPETIAWINTHTWTLLAVNFVVFTCIFQILMFFTRINVLKPIILIGTLALAMSFAANDLVNFIGVPLAGLNGYTAAVATGQPLTANMEALQRPIQSNTIYLLISGVIMVITLWFSRKARTVTKTELSLVRQSEGVERFESSHLAQIIVGMSTTLFDLILKIIPKKLRRKVARRLDVNNSPALTGDGGPPTFDLIRASVNLIVASALVAYATSMKLPLSTTYVTFMVSMGTSFSDQAWGRESAVYRVTGVLMVIGGWFFTALMAFTVSLIFAFAISYLKVFAVIALLGLVAFIIWRNLKLHGQRETDARQIEVFNLKKVTDANLAINTSFEHSGYFLNVVRDKYNACCEALFSENLKQLKVCRKKTKKLQEWSNIIVANIFKTLRLLHKKDMDHAHKYSQTIGALQEITESLRDILLRSYLHHSNQHRGLLEVQIEELKQIQACVDKLLENASQVLLVKRNTLDHEAIEDILAQNESLKAMIDKFDRNQIKRIQTEQSKTRLSILFYALSGNSQKICDQAVNLLSAFRDTFRPGSPQRTPAAGEVSETRTAKTEP